MVIGIDEVGRGTLFGDVVAVALYWQHDIHIPELTDSKKLSAKKREQLFEIISKNAVFTIGRATAVEIDEINILRATLLAMKRAFAALPQHPYPVVTDGTHCPEVPDCTAIIKGDSKISEISAASIIAKVTRDREMLLFDEKYPHYGFAAHKGYGTKAHIEAIKQYGVLPEHRKTFAPLRKMSLHKQ